jgi:hypothetical protein
MGFIELVPKAFLEVLDLGEHLKLAAVRLGRGKQHRCNSVTISQEARFYLS